MLYLKWLTTSDGCRVSERDAVAVFGSMKHSEETVNRVLAIERWVYVQSLNMTCLEWVELLQAQEEVRKLRRLT